MANFTYYKSVTDNGGDRGDQIQDGGVNDLLPMISAADRLHGREIVRKFWIESDEDVTIYAGLYPSSGEQVALVMSDADTVDDLTGDEPKYGPMLVTANDDSSVTMTNDPVYGAMIRDGDYFWLGGDLYAADSVTDNGDGTTTVTISGTFPDGSDFAGRTLHSMCSGDLTADTARSFFVYIDVPAGSDRGDGIIAMNLLMVTS